MSKLKLFVALVTFGLSSNASAWFLDGIDSMPSPDSAPYNTFGGRLTIEPTDDDFGPQCGGQCYNEISMASVLYNPSNSIIDTETAAWYLGYPVGYWITHWVNWWATGLPTGLYRVDSQVFSWREEWVYNGGEWVSTYWQNGFDSSVGYGNVPFL